jgi:hypothetical protein
MKTRVTPQGACKRSPKAPRRPYSTPQAMETVLSIHQELIRGTLATFRRLPFKGHWLDFYSKNALAHFSSRQGTFLKEGGAYVETASGDLKAYIEYAAEDTERPYLHSEKNWTTKGDQSKENCTQVIAQQNEVTTGLICVFAVVGLCWPNQDPGSASGCG